MTNEETIKMLKQWNEDLSPYEDEKSGIECHNIAISALEKQIPKKVNVSLKGTTGWNTKCHCPNCHSMVSHGKYCANCGQALIWEDHPTEKGGEQE